LKMETFLKIENIELWARVGVLDEERKLGQLFSLDILLWTDFEKCTLNDDIKKTVDYSKLVQILKDYGYLFVGPEKGEMACGEYGEGKMSDPSIIAEEIDKYFLTQKNNKKFKALVTAGPTKEYIDPVRFITNKSSGKQGYELAKSLSKKGFDTTLISGPTNLEITKDINLIKVETADEMLVATQENLPVNVAIFSAAVADFKIIKKYENKIKKQENLNLNLEKNVDILHYVSNHNSMRPDLVIGFAAETNEIDKNAEEKLNKKNCDWIISNDVSN